MKRGFLNAGLKSPAPTSLPKAGKDGPASRVPPAPSLTQKPAASAAKLDTPRSRGLPFVYLDQDRSSLTIEAWIRFLLDDSLTLSAHKPVAIPIYAPPTGNKSSQAGKVSSQDLDDRIIFGGKRPDHAIIMNLPSDTLDCTCFIYPAAKPLIDRLKFSSPPSPPSELPYRIESVEGAGLGMLSKRSFAKGEHILAERPVIVFPRTVAGYNNQALEMLVEKMLTRLSERTRKGYKDLSTCKSDCGKLFGIFLTNAQGVEFGDDDRLGYSGVSLDMSRCNHSCSPNATKCFNRTTMCFELHALQPIAPNEEITISYIGVLLPSSQRQSRISNLWSFTCTCPSCTLPPALQTVSDGRRMRLTSWPTTHPTLSDWVKDYSQPDNAFVRQCLEAMKLVMEEKVWESETEYLEKIASAYLALGDSKGWKMWGSKAAMMVRTEGRTKGVGFYLTEDPSTLEGWNVRNIARPAR